MMASDQLILHRSGVTSHCSHSGSAHDPMQPPQLRADQALRWCSLSSTHVLGEQKLWRSVGSLSKGILLCDANKPGWPVLFATTVMGRLACVEPAELVGRPLAELFEPTGTYLEWLVLLQQGLTSRLQSYLDAASPGHALACMLVDVLA